MPQAELLSAPQRNSTPRHPRPARPSPPRGSLKHGFAWLAAGNIVSAVCVWGRVALLARHANSEMIGQLTLAWAICNPISSLLDLGLSGALVSDARGDFRTLEYVRLRFATGLATLFAIGAALWLGLCGSGGNSWLVLAAGLVVVVESICDIFQAQTQRCEAMQWVSLSLIARGVLGLAAFAVIHLLTGNLSFAVAGLAAAALLTLFAIDVPVALHYGRPDSRLSLRESCATFAERKATFRLAWLSLPLGLATASLELTTSLPRYAVGRMLGPAALGSFAVAGGLMVAVSLVVGAMSQAASPRLARHFAAGDVDNFLKLVGRLLLLVGLVGAAAAIGMAVAGKPLLHLFYGPRYVPLDRLAAMLMVVAGLRNVGILLSRTLCSMRKFRLNLVLRGLGLVALAALLPGWVATHGVWGAAWALGLSWLFSILLATAAVLHGAAECRRTNATLLA